MHGSNPPPVRDENYAYIAQALATPGGHLSIGPYGSTLHFARGSTLSGFHCDAMKAACAAAGLPVLDSRGLGVAARWSLAVRGPMVAVGEPADEPPYHALSQAPLAHVAALYRAVGGEVLNLPDSEGGTASRAVPELADAGPVDRPEDSADA